MYEEGIVYKRKGDGVLIVVTDIIRVSDAFDPVAEVKYEYWTETIDGKIQVHYDGELEETEQPNV